MNKLFWIILGVLILFFTYLNIKREVPKKDIIYGNIFIDGSSTVFPIMEACTKIFEKTNPHVTVINNVSGTGGGFKKFCIGNSDINSSSRKMDESEKILCLQNSVEYFEFFLGYDGIVLVTNVNNDYLDSITLEQLNLLFNDHSKLISWNEVNSDWPKESISLWSPGLASGTYDYFCSAILTQSKMRNDITVFSEDDNMLVTGVTSNLNSLGFFGFAYYLKNKQNLKLIGLKNSSGKVVYPTVDTIENGEYLPLSRGLYLYISKKSFKKLEIRLFLDFCCQNLEEVITKIGYVPLTSSRYKEQMDIYLKDN